MIKTIDIKNEAELKDILQFLKAVRNPDFYLTKDNRRIYINTLENLKDLLQESKDIYFYVDEKVQGVSLIWEAQFGDGYTRKYVKVASKSNTITEELLNTLDNTDSELFVKVSKKSTDLISFRKKGFTFAGGRGKQILLKRRIMKKV